MSPISHSRSVTAAAMAGVTRMRARAEEDGGRYRFRVAVAHPWPGLLFAYRGDIG